MGERVMKVPLSELKLVRVVCKGTTGGGPCGAVFEMPLERLATTFRESPQLAVWRCPFCKEEYHLSDPRGGHLDPFAPFVKAALDLASLGDRLGVEFVLPEGTADA